jgi:hypothetical protein
VGDRQPHLYHAPDDTGVVCDRSIDDWCAQYVDSGQCRIDWRTLHTAALHALYEAPLPHISSPVYREPQPPPWTIEQ